MPKSRLPKEVWRENIRPMIWYRDGQRCTRCGISVTLNKCHIDHKKSGRLGSNSLNNLRTLCLECHNLRSDLKHNGMRSNALKRGTIKPGWREESWD